MVSCSALYNISARLALALGEPNEAFRVVGLNMIFAGDFAQLPPVRASSLYVRDDKVSSIVHSKQLVQDQKNSIGKNVMEASYHCHDFETKHVANRY